MDRVEVALSALWHGSASEGSLHWFAPTSVESVPVVIYANCSDFFYWGTSDCEEITEGNIDLFVRSHFDMATCCGSKKGGLLFCARVRQERPQGAYYKYLPQESWKFFDECGPEREPRLGNPHPRPELSTLYGLRPYTPLSLDGAKFTDDFKRLALRAFQITSGDNCDTLFLRLVNGEPELHLQAETDDEIVQPYVKLTPENIEYFDMSQVPGDQKFEIFYGRISELETSP